MHGMDIRFFFQCECLLRYHMLQAKLIYINIKINCIFYFSQRRALILNFIQKSLSYNHIINIIYRVLLRKHCLIYKMFYNNQKNNSQMMQSVRATCVFNFHVNIKKVFCIYLLQCTSLTVPFIHVFICSRYNEAVRAVFDDKVSW